LGRFSVSGTETDINGLTYQISSEEIGVALDTSNISLFHLTDFGIEEITALTIFAVGEIKKGTCKESENCKAINSAKKLEIRIGHLTLNDTGLTLFGLSVDLLVESEEKEFQRLSQLSIPTLQLTSNLKEGSSLKEKVKDYFTRALQSVKILLEKKGLLKNQNL